MLIISFISLCNRYSYLMMVDVQVADWCYVEKLVSSIERTSDPGFVYMKSMLIMLIHNDDQRFVFLLTILKPLKLLFRYLC